MTPRELIRRMQLTAVRARSNAAEGGTLDVAERVDPFIYGSDDLSLLGISARMLEGTPTAMDAYNLLTIADRSPSVAMIYGIRWGEDLPDAGAFLREHLT